ncbi:MAG: MBL fold metallo-hydrolase [Bacteroidota bacterium]
MRNFRLTVLLFFTGLSSVSAQLSIEYVANMGVLIEAGEKRILIDGLFEPLLEDYDAPSNEIVEKLLVDSGTQKLTHILITHHHKDHASDKLTEKLAHRTDLFMFSPEIKIGLDESVTIEQEVFSTQKFSFGGIPITVIRLPHVANSQKKNNCYLLEINGLRLLHTGDANLVHLKKAFIRALWQEADVVMIPFFELLQKKKIIDEMGWGAIIPLHYDNRMFGLDAKIEQLGFSNIHFLHKRKWDAQ